MTPISVSMLSVLSPLCPGSPATAIGDFGCALADNQTTVLLAGGLLLAVIGLSAVRRSRASAEAQAPPVLVFPLDRDGATRRRRPPPADTGERGVRERGRREAPADPGPTTGLEHGALGTRRGADGDPGAGPPPASSAGPGAADPLLVGSQRMIIPPDSPHRPPEAPGSTPDQNGGSSTWVEAGAVRFEEPPEGTLQLLPGRLEIEAGAGAGREIRFVRVPGQEPEVTFGRNTGAPYRHVQLRSPTVSRMHARLRFDNGRWTLRNESTTNPTVLNGRSLDSTEACLLDDGDRIEMGEVVFLFHQPQGRDRLPHRSSWYTDRGRRNTNQDAVAVRTLGDRRELAVICDGMGAQAAGELASHRALEVLVETLEQGEDLGRAVRAANRAVRERATGDPEGGDMGTTLVALLRDGNEYRIANVGDSRAYRIDAGGIRQISEDHSFVTEVVKEGRMSLEEAVRSPWRNAVTRHLGAEDEVDVDMFGAFDADESHLVLLCSDGAHSVLTADAMESLLRRTAGVQDMAGRIGEAALQEGSDDNVSVVVLQFGTGLGGASSGSTGPPGARGRGRASRKRGTRPGAAGSDTAASSNP